MRKVNVLLGLAALSGLLIAGLWLNNLSSSAAMHAQHGEVHAPAGVAGTGVGQTVRLQHLGMV